jgi:hypothetical protein
LSASQLDPLQILDFAPAPLGGHAPDHCALDCALKPKTI